MFNWYKEKVVQSYLEQDGGAVVQVNAYPLIDLNTGQMKKFLGVFAGGAETTGSSPVSKKSL